MCSKNDRIIPIIVGSLLIAWIAYLLIISLLFADYISVVVLVFPIIIIGYMFWSINRQIKHQDEIGVNFNQIKYALFDKQRMATDDYYGGRINNQTYQNICREIEYNMPTCPLYTSQEPWEEWNRQYKQWQESNKNNNNGVACVRNQGNKRTLQHKHAVGEW